MREVAASVRASVVPHVLGVSVENHVIDYAIEGLLLGTFLLSASAVTVALEHPASPIHGWLPSPTARRVLTGLAMGLTSMALVYSRPGRRSGAHMNPALTLTFLRLGKIAPADAAGYVSGQFAGAMCAMSLLAWIAGPWVAHPAVDYVRTVPGPAGEAAAFFCELAISCGMVLVVLLVSNSRWRAWTGLTAGLLVATYICLESPISGMSMNPARTFGPAAAAGAYDALWIYFVAPLSGMLAGAEIYVRRYGLHAITCAKLHHDAQSRCLFRCGYSDPAAGMSPRTTGSTIQPVAIEQ